MPINPLTGLEEDELDPMKALGISPAVPAAAQPTADAPQVDVKDYIMKKFNLGDYSDEKRKELEKSTESGFTDKIGDALSAIGAGFMGQDPNAAGMSGVKQRQAERDLKLGNFDKGRQQAMQNVEFERTARDDMNAQQKLEREMDPNSTESQMARDLATSMGMNPDQAKSLTAAKFKEFSPVLQKKYEISEKRLDRQEARDERRFQSGIKMDEKQLVRDEKKKASLMEVEDRRRNIEDNLTSLETMIKDKGTYEMFGSHNADLDRKVDQIATDMAKLMDPNSVARPSEVEMFKKGLVQANMAGMKNSTALEILKNFRKETDARTANAYKIRGIENPGTQKERNTTKDTGHSPGDVVKVKGKNYRVGADGDSLEEI